MANIFITIVTGLVFGTGIALAEQRADGSRSR